MFLKLCFILTYWIENVNNYFMLVKIVLGGSILIKEIVNLILALCSFQFEFNWKLI